MYDCGAGVLGGYLRWSGNGPGNLVVETGCVHGAPRQRLACDGGSGSVRVSTRSRDLVYSNRGRARGGWVQVATCQGTGAW